MKIKEPFMKYAPIYTLFLLAVVHSSCGQSQTNTAKDNARPRSPNYSEAKLKEADSSTVPISMVRNVKQASNGDILIASYFAVYRYDGRSFTNLTNKIISPRFSSFWDVLEDRKGNLWFATKDSGVYYYNGKSLPSRDAGLQHFTTEDGLGSNQALHIYEDKAGNIWFGTAGGATRYDGKSFRNFTTKDGLPNNDINTFMEDKTGRLWIGTRGDACYYDPRLDNESGQGKAFTVLRNQDGDAFYNVWGIVEDRKGNIWFGGSIVKDKRGSTLYLDPGLWRYDGSTITKVSQRGAYSIIEDKKGNIWTAGEVNPPNAPVWALSRYDANTLYDKTPTVTEIKSGGRMDFLGLLEATDGSIWFGSGRGVHRYDGKTFTDFKNNEGQK